MHTLAQHPHQKTTPNSGLACSLVFFFSLERNLRELLMHTLSCQLLYIQYCMYLRSVLSMTFNGLATADPDPAF